ncbi:hypothetical protein FF2_025821 [Malus domestica]
MYVTAVQPTDLNRNTEWFTYAGVWTTYILVVFFSWLTVRPLPLLLLSRHGLDRLPPLPLSRYLSLFSLEERNTVCR